MLTERNISTSELQFEPVFLIEIVPFAPIGNEIKVDTRLFVQFFSLVNDSHKHEHWIALTNTKMMQRKLVVVNELLPLMSARKPVCYSRTSLCEDPV